MSVFQGSDLTSWYNRLNAVRQKQNINLGTVAVPTVTGQPAKASDLTSLRDIILGMKSNTYLSYADYTGIDSLNVAVGTPTLQADFNIIENAIDSMESVCGNNATSTNITTGNSTNSTCTTYNGDNIDVCSTNATTRDATCNYSSGCLTTSDLTNSYSSASYSGGYSPSNSTTYLATSFGDRTITDRTNSYSSGDATVTNSTCGTYTDDTNRTNRTNSDATTTNRTTQCTTYSVI